MDSLTKITVPRSSGIVARERVFSLLDEGMARPVLWIASPAGSGKTTIVAHYLQTRKRPCLWYSADSGDADMATFFYYMGLAARTAVPRYRRQLPLLTPEYVRGIPVFARRYFEALYERLKSGFVIVFDNYQEVPVDSVFHEVMTIGLSAVPEGINIIVVSRNAAPAVYTRLIASNGVSRVGWDEIRLTEEESREIVLKNERRPVSDETLALLYRKTEGWAAGLVLLMESLRSTPLDYSVLNRLTPAEVYDYFATEIFKKTDPQEQEFLCETAFLPSMTAEMARKLTGNEASSEILRRLNECNYFTERHLKDDPVYLYHPLFREFLISRARKAMSAPEIATLQRKAAEVLTDADQMEDAAALLVDAAAWDRLIPLVLSQAPSLMARGRTGTIEQWLERIPGAIVEKSPWLLYWKGVCRLVLSPVESRGFFEKAFHSFEREPSDAGALLAWSGAVQTFLFEFHDFRPLDRWIDWLDERMKRGIVYPSPQIEASVVSGMIGALAWRAPFHPSARMWAEKAAGLSGSDLDIDTRLRVDTNTAIFHIWMGEFTESGRLLESIKRMVQAGPSSPARRILLGVVEAMHCNCAAVLEQQARLAVSEGLAVAGDSGVHIADTLLYLQGAASALNEGNIEAALGFLAEMKKGIGPSQNAHSGHYYYFLSWCLLISGENRQALVAARQSLQSIQEAGIPVSETLIRLALVQVLHESGDMDEAAGHLASASTISAWTGSSYCAFLCEMTRAQLLFAASDPVDPAGIRKHSAVTPGGPTPAAPAGESQSSSTDEQALASLRRALALGRGNGYVTMMYFWRPEELGYLCARALEAGIEKDYVKELIRGLRLKVPGKKAVHTEAWPYPVKIRTFGSFSLDIDGMKASSAVKAQKKPLLLLKALISLGGSGVGEEELCDILWPDAEGDAGHNAFKTTLARLRQMLGNDKAIVLRGNKVSLDNRYCWTDKGAFEELCTEAESIMRGSTGARTNSDLGKVISRIIALYQGRFLPTDSEEPWTVITRERLRSRYLTLISEAGRAFGAMDNQEEAARCYLKGLEAEPLAEEFYQGLIMSYVSLGRKSEATAVYERCARTLGVALGIAPSEKTRRLIQG